MRHLEWEACYNVRDLGGYPTRDGAETRWRAAVRADNLCRLTEAGRAALIDYGVRTIVDLRFPDEVERSPNPFSDPAVRNHTLTLFNIPLRGKRSKEAEEAFKAARTNADTYRLALDYSAPAFQRVMAVIADAPEGAVLFHCHAGKDRTGLVAALLLALAGVPDEIIAADYAESHTHLKPMYDEILNQITDPAERERFLADIAAGPQHMLSTLSYLNSRYGGAKAYLLHAGVARKQLEKLERRMREPAPGSR